MSATITGEYRLTAKTRGDAEEIIDKILHNLAEEGIPITFSIDPGCGDCGHPFAKHGAAGCTVGWARQWSQRPCSCTAS